MIERTLHIIMVAFRRALPLRIAIDCLLVQTCSRWKLQIIHDGPVPPDVLDIINSYHDDRIGFFSTDTVQGSWGHPNRDLGLKILESNSQDFVLITNDDNYYVPEFIEQMLQKTERVVLPVGLVFCDTVHSYMKYSVLTSQLKENQIDMGSFIVRLDIAKKVGFKHRHLSADGRYAEECADFCRRTGLVMKRIPRPLFIHN